MSDKKRMKNNVFTNQLEIFFGKFPETMTEWLERLAKKTGRFSVTTLKNWISKLVKQLISVSNPTTQAIDFWLDSILGGYVI